MYFTTRRLVHSGVHERNRIDASSARQRRGRDSRRICSGRGGLFGEHRDDLPAIQSHVPPADGGTAPEEGGGPALRGRHEEHLQGAPTPSHTADHDHIDHVRDVLSVQGHPSRVDPGSPANGAALHCRVRRGLHGGPSHPTGEDTGAPPVEGDQAAEHLPRGEGAEALRDEGVLPRSERHRVAQRGQQRPVF